MFSLTDEITYRDGSIDDLQQIKQLGLSSYGKYSEVLTSEHYAILHHSLSDEEKWISLLQSSKSFVCVHNHKIIGMAFIIPRGNPWDVFDAEWSYIRMIGVAPGYEGRGIARTLTKLCVDHARKNGESTVALHTSEFMDAARHIYESLGFIKLKEISPRFGKRYWLYTMSI